MPTPAANLTTLYSAVLTALQTLVSTDGSGSLKAVRETYVDPEAEARQPVLGLQISRLTCQDQQSQAELLVSIAYRGTPGELVTLIAAVKTAVYGVNGTSAGGTVDTMGFDTFWQFPKGSPAVLMGALGTVLLTVDGI